MSKFTYLFEDAIAAPTDRACGSVEADPDHETPPLDALIQQHPSLFLHYLDFLSPNDQQIILASLVLRKPQDQIGPIIGLTQTQTATAIHLALLRFSCALIAGGTITPHVINKLLKKAGMEYIPGTTIRLVTAIILFCDRRDCRPVATELNLPRTHGWLSVYLRRVAVQLYESHDRQLQAFGAWLSGELDEGPYRHSVKRRAEISVDIYASDPMILGQFRIDVTRPGFEQLFASRAADLRADSEFTHASVRERRYKAAQAAGNAS